MRGPWFLYLDESGDLGFDRSKEGRSKFFTVCILAVSSATRNKSIAKAVQKTLRRKLNPKKKRNRSVKELKGSQTNQAVKDYFFRQLSGVHFGIYALTLNKNRLYPELQRKKERTYNYLSRLILDQIPFEDATEMVHLTIDKRKPQPEIVEFNRYITKELYNRLQPGVHLLISHDSSEINAGLQAVDMFCYGISRKYERGNYRWFNVFRGKVRWDELYLRPKEK
ncbi:MAG: DUF3800 domain-containing protein [Deltaproteobacteria bacterium]|nr:DUF3800 domain-containing protein [Deltaproteobacteria bacterium]